MYASESDQLELLLVFATGMNTIPALGFDPEPTLAFKHPEDTDPSDKAGDFPFANTCTNTILLPVLNSYDKFAENVTSAIMLATTFTAA